jgi:hypothetical protein
MSASDLMSMTSGGNAPWSLCAIQSDAVRRHDGKVSCCSVGEVCDIQRGMCKEKRNVSAGGR